jgi:plasmid stabilization system protein ParE
VNRKVTFHRLASRELNDAAQYYESRSAGLGEAFLQEIERCIRHIVLYPRAGAVLGGEIRRWLARAFSYAVIYAVKPSRIRVLAVMHLKRHPSYWAGRK